MAGGSLFNIGFDFNANTQVDLTGFKNRFVKMGTGGLNIVTGADIVCGVLQDTGITAGKNARVAQLGLVNGVAGGTITRGDRLELGASGKVVSHTAGTGTRQIVVGVAFADAVDGAIFTMQIPAPFGRGEI